MSPPLPVLHRLLPLLSNPHPPNAPHMRFSSPGYGNGNGLGAQPGEAGGGEQREVGGYCWMMGRGGQQQEPQQVAESPCPQSRLTHGNWAFYDTATVHTGSTFLP